jgi:hypothetical protein
LVTLELIAAVPALIVAALALLRPLDILPSPRPMSILLLTTLPESGAILQTFVRLRSWCRSQHDFISGPELSAVQHTRWVPNLGWGSSEQGRRYTPAGNGNPQPDSDH